MIRCFVAVTRCLAGSAIGLLLAASACGADPVEQDYYRLVQLPIPDPIVLEVGALDLLPDGRLAVATRRGEIWFLANPFTQTPRDIQFTRYAHGLHEVLGLSAVGDSLLATQRGEVTRIRDTNWDGIADLFETLNDNWSISGDYHEYAIGSPPDKDGNIWVVLCLTGSFSSEVPYRGWCVRVTPDGRMLPTCSGVRSPGGIGFNANGDCFFTDNQGPWNGTCSLKHLRPGGFMGHPVGNKWYSLAPALGPRPAEPVSGSRMMVEAQRIPELVPPAVYFPYQKMGQSASGIACDTTQGKFGPFAGQLFVGDQTHSTLMRVFLEQVRGQYQGACFPFRSGFGSGSVALKMTPAGSLFVGGTNRGWGSRGPLPYSLDRLEWTGRVPFEIQEMRVLKDGFELRFTGPVDRKTAAEVSSYTVQTYTYLYHSTYGSPEVDGTHPAIQEAQVSADGRRVKLRIDSLAVGHVHELHAAGVRSAHGTSLLHAEAYYTLNYLPEE